MNAMPGLFFLLALLAGCAEMPQSPPSETEASAAAGYGRAFGSARYGVGDPGLASKAWTLERFVLFVRSVADGSMQYMDIPPAGDFAWPLRAGEYDIIAYQAVRNMGWKTGRVSFTNSVMARFSVPAAGQAVYIGELRIETHGGATRQVVGDDFEAAAARMRPRLAGFEPAKGLLRPEPEPGSMRRLISICAPTWGLSCDRTFQGVVPLSPKGVGEDFPLVADLRPVLEWKPSSRGDVTYDVAIYESLSFLYGATGNASRLRGSLVAYAEGLAAPRFQPAEDLPAGKKLEWTVRVRDGDTVSTWSTTSYSVYLVVAGKRGSGLNFGFQTPRK
ncbi:MAG TPA: hypothetical protein VEB41_00385 [Burkholderiales bacterium]|nr:hypothetical protein [Burkholderiales bacterium]